MNQSTVVVRAACATDLEAILALERATDNAPHWPAATYSGLIEDHAGVPRRCVFVAQAGTGPDAPILGFVVGLVHAADLTAELESVAVAASARRAGIGRVLCTAVLGWCQRRGAASVLLEVRASSASAIGLYASLGFTVSGRRARYYRDPEDDALLLRLALAPSSTTATNAQDETA